MITRSGQKEKRQCKSGTVFQCELREMVAFGRNQVGYAKVLNFCFLTV
jgi:hypothetical protein